MRRARCRARRTYFALCTVHLALLAASCAPKPLALPGGPSTPLSDPAPLSEALAHCRDDGTLTAEIGLSGRAGGERLRGTLHAGFAPPRSIRLEGVPPFGAPIFLLAGQGGTATLLLPRENRVLRDAPAGEILETLAGLDASAADLRAWLAGCPSAAPRPRDAAAYGADWAAADLDEGRRVWVRRLAGGWRAVAVVAPPLTIEFDEHAGAQPGRVRIRRAAADSPPLDIRLAVRQVERGARLADEAFSIDVPADAIAITLDELRASGPLRDTKTSQ